MHRCQEPQRPFSILYTQAVYLQKGNLESSELPLISLLAGDALSADPGSMSSFFSEFVIRTWAETEDMELRPLCIALNFCTDPSRLLLVSQLLSELLPLLLLGNPEQPFEAEYSMLLVCG